MGVSEGAVVGVEAACAYECVAGACVTGGLFCSVIALFFVGHLNATAV